MRKKSHDSMDTVKVLLYAQMAASIVPIFAHIALLIMAWMQHNWMMLAMIVPSIMMYAASLIPQILQYITQQQQENYAHQLHKEHESNRIVTNTNSKNSHIENLPDTLTPASLETLLMQRTTAAQSKPPWREVLRTWLANENTTTRPSSKEHLSAPLGINSHGYCCIDLVDNGPHALVAGTTGSGKSVLLTTWCLALAFRYSPQQLRFVFMDFKGGATFDTLADLPHTMGNVGDLNLRHAVRALRGLELELDRRERLVANQRCHTIAQVTPQEPSLLIVIDEFHALKDQLPDYMSRLIRIAAVGRSLGMHIIAGTQNPLGQVSADMKANIAINICLRVRDSLQSQELLGTSHAANISPNTPGSAYYNLGEGVEALRCARSRNPQLLVAAIQLASKFLHYQHAPLLFSAPLPSLIFPNQIQQYCTENYESYTTYESYERNVQPKEIEKNPHFINSQKTQTQLKPVVIGLQDTGIRLLPAALPLHLGNVAIIGGRLQGKSNVIRILAHKLELPVYCATELSANDTYIIQDDHTPLILDDVDELLEPLSTQPQAIALQERLTRSSAPVIMSMATSRHLRLPEQAPVRIIFPTGDIGTDTMLGVPNSLSKTFDTHDYQLPGRCVMITPGEATVTQISLCEYTK